MQNKIFWFGFKRNLAELYYLLFYEKFITCDEGEFSSHFTGKKFRGNERSGGKVIWNGEKCLLILVLHHLIQKGFLQMTIDDEGISLLKEHFKGLLPEDIEKYKRLKNSARAKKLSSKLECLFPETSGLRCKQRLYYKERNKKSMIKVLEECGIVDLTHAYGAMPSAGAGTAPAPLPGVEGSETCERVSDNLKCYKKL